MGFLIHGIIKHTVLNILRISLIVSILRIIIIIISIISILLSIVSIILRIIIILIHGSAPLKKQEILGMPTMY